MVPESIEQQIDNTLKSSPANTPSVKKIKPTTNERNIVDVNELLQQASVAMLSQSDRIKLSQPIDRSRGIIEPDYVGKPTKRVATTRTLSTKGAKDIEQFEYPLDDSRGAAVEGAEEDGILLGSRDMGVAFGGEHLAASGDLRNMDGSEGNPYFLKDKTPSIFKEVAPFPVSLPAYDLEVQSKTTNRAKLAYQLATSIQGEPEDYFIGYERIPDSEEGFWSGLQKGISTGTTDLAHSVAKGGLFAFGLLSQGAHKVYGHIIGADDEWFDMAEKEIEDNVSHIAQYVDKLNQQYTKSVGGELTSKANMWAQIGKGIPSAIGQIGLMSLGGAAGNWPMQIIMGGMQGQATWEAMEGLGLSASERNWRALGSAGVSTILNRVGIFSMAQSRLSVARRFASNTYKRMASVGAQSMLGALGEGVTELGDELVQDMFAMNIKDDNFSQRMDNYTTSLLLGAISGLVSVPANIRAEQYAIASEKVLANKLGKSASQLEASLKKFAVAAENAGLMSAKEAMDLAYIMSLPAAQAQMDEAMRRNIDAIYDRADPQTLKNLLARPFKEAAETMQDFKNLDTKVMQALPKDMKDSTKIMITRAMRGVASVLSIYAHKDIEVPAFKYRAGLSEYDPKTNTIYISRNLQLTTEADQFVRNRDLKKIMPEQRSLLHEIGHMLDVQLGTNSNFKEFLPAYFNAISKVFGPKRALNVKKAMPKSGERVGNVTQQADYMSDKNTTEWFAYSLGRLGRAAGDAIGLTGDVAHLVDVANVMAKQLLIPDVQAALTEYNNAMAELIKQNDDTLVAMAKAAGEKGLADAIERYISGDDSAMSKEDVAALYRVLKSYVGSEGAKILSEAFANVSTETFMERTNREFRESIEDAPTRGKKKVGDTELEDFGGEDGIEVDGYTPDDIFALNERPKTSLDKLNETQTLPMNEKENPFRRKQTHLERRVKASKKVGGLKSFDENVKKITGILSAKDYKPVSKFFTKVFGGYGSGDINTYLNMISPEIQKEFDLVEGFATAEADALSAMREMWEDAGLTNRYKRNVFINNLNQPSIEAKHVYDGMGGYMTTTITPNQALNIYLGAKTKARSNWIATFGGNEAEMEAVINQLTPEQKAFGDAMQEFLRKKYLNRKLYTEEELLDMSDETREALGLAPDESLDVQAFLAEQDAETLYWPRLSMSHDLDDRRPNYDIARKFAPNDPSSFKVPATETVGSYIYRMSAGKSDVYSKIRRIKDLFFYNAEEETGNMDKKAKEISEHVQKESLQLRRRALKAFGNSERTMENFRNLLNDYLNGVHDKEVGTDLVNKIMRNYIAGQIAWKPIQFLKNTMNTFMFWGMAPKQGQYWADTAWAATHWSEAKQYMIDKVPWMRTRYENAEMDEQLRQSTSASDSMLMTWAEGKNLSESSRNAVSNIVAISQAAKRVGYAPMMAGDAVSNIIGGYGVLKQYIEMYGEAEGVRMFTQQLATKQSNTNRAVKSLMQREWNKGFRGQFIAFMSEPIGKTKSMALAIENANRGEITWKQAGMEIASTFMSMAMFSLISAGVVDLFDEDEENDEEVYKALGREGISMITGFHPLGGSVLAPIVSELFLDGQQSISSPFTTGVFRALNALEDGDWSKIVAESAGATGMIIGAGVLEDMLTGLVRTPSDDEAYAESGWRMLSGESQKRAEKRAGYKEPVEKKEDE